MAWKREMGVQSMQTRVEGLLSLVNRRSPQCMEVFGFPGGAITEEGEGEERSEEEKLETRASGASGSKRSHLGESEPLDFDSEPSAIIGGQRFQDRQAIEMEDGGDAMDVNPASTAARSKLQRTMKADKVSHMLERRSDVEELTKGNILKDMSVAPMLQSKQRELQKNLAKSNLYHALKHRPSLEELQDRGIISNEQKAASLQQQQQQLFGAVPGMYPQQIMPMTQQQDQFGGDLMVHQQQLQMQQQQQPLSGQQMDFSAMGAAQHAIPPSSSASDQQQVYGTTYQRRSKNFHLTRILLKFVASMAEAGEISLQKKGVLKDLIVDQDAAILAVAECYDNDRDVSDFKDSLTHLANRD
eukprot:g67080.t1